MGVHAMFASLILCLVHSALAQTGILPCGILYNRDEPSLIQNGFIKCYDQPYSHVTTTTELAACSGKNVVFVGAKSNSSTTTIALGAFGLSSNVYKVTSSTTTANRDPGGAYWYKYPAYGFGFSGVSAVNIYDCDYGQLAGDCAYRLCWNLDFSIGGYRVGCLENLNMDPTWRKVMYKGDQVYSCISVCSNGAIRLQNGTTTANGRVEVCYNNSWGTVCDNMWGNQDAQVACRQFGYTAGTALSNAYYGKGNVSVLLDNVNCLGTETSLLNCPNSGIGVTSCTHADDASVQCSGCGVLYNYDEPTLYLSGYTKCYDQPYSHVTTSAELAACAGTNWVFVGAKNSSNSTTIVLGAFGYSSAVYTTTSSTTTAYLDKYGGAYWYNYPTYGFGFSGVSSVKIYNCDAGQAAGNCAYRLCWNIDFGLAGYRVGCLENLNSNANRRKVMYKGNEVQTCTSDVNECLSINGNCSQICTNTLGSYYCSCTAGYMLNADNQTCVDINECLALNGNCSQICYNTPGSATCSCMTGYVLNPDLKTCTDINECAGNMGNCSQLCNNIDGSYYCNCWTGYRLNPDNKTCSDTNECTVNNGGCTQMCSNTDGSFLCSCGTDYSLNADNLTCVDSNECTINNGNCSQICSNTDGSYACLCMTGYILNADGKICNGPTTLIQLRLTEVDDCNYWTLDNGNTKLITQLVDANVNAFCSCGFTIYNPKIYCFDSVSITLRGSSETKLVTYFQNWVSSQNSTLDVQGRILLADKNCEVIIQSLDGGACQTTIKNSALTLTTQVGISVGAIIAFIVALVIILLVILALWAKRKMKKATFSNPIYSKENIEQVQYDRVNEFQMSPINTSADAEYATVNDNPVSNHEDIDANGICMATGNNTSMSNYEPIGSSSKGYETCIIAASAVDSSNRNPSANNYDHIGDPFVLHYDTPNNLASTINEAVVENTSAIEDNV